MPEKVTCPKCQAENFSTDRECLSCGADLSVPGAAPATGAPAAAAPAPRPGAAVAEMRKKPLSRRSDLGWTQRRVAQVAENQVGSLIGMGIGGVLLLVLEFAGGAFGGGSPVGAVVFSLIAVSVTVYFFIQYTSDPDVFWPLIVCVLVSGCIGWLLIAGGAFAGAAIEAAATRPDAADD